jgi:hypothetical protein
MSTQRRENGSTPATKTCRRGPRGRWQRYCTECTRETGRIWLILLGWFVRAVATVGTAPTHASLSLRASSFHPSDEGLSPGTPEWLATNSLQSGHRFTQPVRQEICRPSPSSPPNRAARRAIAGAPATCRSSLRLNPAPSVLERLHPFLAYIPAGKCRWTERYDGKRDLYFLNAA